MATVYKETDRCPVPAGSAVELRKVKGVPKPHAVFIDGRARKRAYALADYDPGKMLVERPCWYIDFVGADGKTHTVKGFTDKGLTERKTVELEKAVERQQAGETSADPLRIRSPFRTVLKQYLADLERAGRDDGYRYNAEKLLTKLADECGCLISLRSGLRRDEIARLCWCHMDLDKPCWLLSAANTKARRAEALEMNAELAEELRRWKPATAGPLDRVVSDVPKWKTYKADLKRAGIPYYDEQGRVASFHALRKTFGTELAQVGVPLVKARHLMRHTDPKLTARIYVDAGVLDLDGAINSLRSLGIHIVSPDDLPEEAA